MTESMVGMRCGFVAVVVGGSVGGREQEYKISRYNRDQYHEGRGISVYCSLQTTKNLQPRGL